jgi:hypothetical protein
MPFTVRVADGKNFSTGSDGMAALKPSGEDNPLTPGSINRLRKEAFSLKGPSPALRRRFKRSP